MKNKFLNILLGGAVVCLTGCCDKPKAELAHPFDFKPIVYNTIANAPELKAPKMFVDENNEVILVEKAGLAGPAFLDINSDGADDLLVGEFSGGKNSNVKVFENKGTNTSPVYSSEFYYLKDETGENLYVKTS